LATVGVHDKSSFLHGFLISRPSHSRRLKASSSAMRRAITVSAVALISVVAAALQLRNAAARPLPSFAGTWELATLELRPMIHRNGHIHPQIAPRVRPMAMTVTQEPDSITVRTDVLDSLDRAAIAPTIRTYRSRSSVSTAMMSISSPQMLMRIDRRHGTLELMTVMQSESGKDRDVPATSTETWRLGPDGTLERRVHDVSAEGVLDRVESWRRLSPR
jgi:hypothetical protein